MKMYGFDNYFLRQKFDPKKPLHFREGDLQIPHQISLKCNGFFNWYLTRKSENIKNYLIKKNFIWKDSEPSTASKWFYVPFLLDQYLTSFWVILKVDPGVIWRRDPFFGHKTFCLWPNICHIKFFSMLFDAEPGWCIADKKSGWNYHFSKSYCNFLGDPGVI